MAESRGPSTLRVEQSSNYSTLCTLVAKCYTGPRVLGQIVWNKCLQNTKFVRKSERWLGEMILMASEMWRAGSVPTGCVKCEKCSD